MAIDFGAQSTLTKAGTTTLLGLNSAGSISRSLTPMFFAYGVHGTTSTSNVIFPSTQFNIGGGYNTSNGRFTAPVTGLYYFYYQQITNAIAGEYRVVFTKNAGWYGGSCYIIHAESAQYMSLHASHHIYLTVNDYVNVNLNSAAGTMYAGAGDVQYGQFSGHFIG